MGAEQPDAKRELALSRLMNAYERDIVNLCCMYLQDIALAEDAAQETFLKAYKGLDRFRNECSEKTWLTRIAIDTCKDMRRAAWFRFVDRKVTLDRLPAPAAPPKTEHILLTLDVMRLPAKEKEAVLLRYFQGMTIDDTAQALGISGTAVSKRLQRALKRLHPAWKGGEEDA